MSDNINPSASSSGHDGTQSQGIQQPEHTSCDCPHPHGEADEQLVTNEAHSTASFGFPKNPNNITIEQTILSHHADYYKDVQPLTIEDLDRLMLTPSTLLRIINSFIARSNYIQAKLIDNGYEPSIPTPPGGLQLGERVEYARKYRKMRDALPTYTSDTHELVDPPLFHAEADKDEVGYYEWVATMRNKMKVNSEIFVNEEIKMTYTLSRIAGNAFDLIKEQAFRDPKKHYESAEEILRQVEFYI
jgi:hypothetical protein